MSNIPSQPFAAAQLAAESLTDPRAQSQLLAELAQQQLASGQSVAALQTFGAIPLPLERRIALLVTNFQQFAPEHVEPLLRLLKTDPQTNLLAGRLAIAMLENNNVRAAWKVLETDRNAFETDEQQYEFLQKVLPLSGADDWDKVLRLYRSVAPGRYQDWASLALIKYLAEQNRPDETTRFIGLLSSQLRDAWANWLVYRLTPEPPERYFDKALEVAEAIAIVSDDEATMEKLAVMLRIFGRTAYAQDRREQGERLLERSESAIAVLPLPIQRYRLQAFLGKVLLELRLIGTIREYLPIDTMLGSLSSGLHRCQLSVWLAESGWNEGWTRAIEAAATPERGVDESERVRQISVVLKRFVAHHQDLKVSGDPAEDAVRLSGESFETFYFDPFAEWDCEC